MAKKLASTILAILFLLTFMSGFPAPVLALGTVNLNPASASVGNTVTASGNFAPDTWVAIKVVDGSGNIVFYDEVQSDSSGAYACSFQVPSVPAGTLDVIAGYGSNVATANLTVNQSGTTTYTVGVAANPSADGTVGGGGSYAAGASVTVTATANSGYRFVNWTEGCVQTSASADYSFTMPATDVSLTANFTTAPSGGGGGGGGSSSQPLSNTGSGTVSPATGGTVKLGSIVSLTIPGAALQGSANVNVTIQQASSPPAPPPGDAIIGAYEFSVGSQESYTFNSPVTLTFSFTPSQIPSGDTPAVYYYNGKKWVLLDGTVSWANDKITVTVNHFTIYAVLAVPQTPAVQGAPTFSDVLSSYWA